jgi:hypothetical protein
MEAFPIAQPLQSLLNDEKTSSTTFSFLFSVTHGNPREIRYLLEFLNKNWTDPKIPIALVSEEWIDERQVVFYNEVLNFDRKCRKEDVIPDPTGFLSKFHKFLSHWFGDPLASSPPAPFTDYGLLYQLENGSWRSTSRPSYHALLQYYFESVVSTFVMDSSDPDILGIRFEALMRLNLTTKVFNQYVWYFGAAAKPTILSLSKVHSHTNELKEKGTPKNLINAPMIFLPASKNFPYWDAVYHEPPTTSCNHHRLVFMQMTVSTPLEHEENGGIMKSFKTLVPQIIFDITGQSVNFTYNKISGDIECQPANSIKLDFVIFTWRTKEEAMKKKANHNYQNLPNNLLIVSKESLPFIPTTKPTSSI